MSRALTNPVQRNPWKRGREGLLEDEGVVSKRGESIGENSYCLSQACVHFLGKGKVYDNKKPLSPCQFQSNCRFEHNFPKTPVTATQRVKLLYLLTLLKEDGRSPERLAALSKVMRQPTFSV